jgi:hypothetical protein
MKHSRWIYTICALALFSAHQTHRRDADKPDYARGPAMIREELSSSNHMADSTASCLKGSLSHKCMKNSQRHRGHDRRPFSVH